MKPALFHVPRKLDRSGKWFLLFLLGWAGSTLAQDVHSATVVGWGDNIFGQLNVPTALTNPVAIAAGAGHSLALRADGTVLAWGDNSAGQATVPAGLTNVIAIAAGWSHSLALRADGTVEGWGEDNDGQVSFQPDLTNVTAISGGGWHSLVLRADGTVIALGQNSFGQAGVPAGLDNVVAVSAGTTHNLALRADGTVVAWGNNLSGQSTVPIGLSNAMAVSAGGHHSLALLNDGTVLAWGANDYGQATVPAGLANVVAVSAGWKHSVALRTDGTVVAWGYNSSGQGTVPEGLTNVRAIVAGGNHNLVLVGDGSAVIAVQPWNRLANRGSTISFNVMAAGLQPLTYQWQFNGADLANKTKPFLTLANLRDRDAGMYRVLVGNSLGNVTSAVVTLRVVPTLITTQPQSQIVPVDGSVLLSVEVQSTAPVSYQWRLNGTNLAGAMGPTLGLTNLSWGDSGRYSVLVSNTYGVVTSADAILSVIALAAWGDNSKAQTMVPPNLDNVVAISGGGWHSLALQADGSVVGWGDNSDGQATVPATLSNIIMVAGGSWHSLALRSDGKVFGWGADYFSQTDVPKDLTNAIAIAAGFYHNLALRADGTVVAWGDNSEGQRAVPANLTNVVAITAGYWHSLALRADGTVVGWGNNSYGQTTIPANLTNVVAVAAGANYSIALRADGTVFAWGDNSHGQVTLPNGLSSVAAIAAGATHCLALRTDGAVVAWGDNGLRQTIVPAGLSNVRAVASGYNHSLASIGRGKPFLTSPLPNRFALAGGTVYFQPNFAGAGPMSYQWQCNGTNLPNATNSVLVLENMQATQNGIYTVVASNALGVTTSLGARLEVVPAWIVWQPQSQLGPLGGSATLRVEIQSISPLRYQWRFNGTNLLGETNATLEILQLDSEDEGRYSVIVSNAYGAVCSVEALLSVVAMIGWGDNYYGQTTPPTDLTNVVAVDIDSHTLALRGDGTVAAWGCNSSGQAVVPEGLSNVVAVAAGSAHSLALRENGTVVAWGDNAAGQTNVPSGLSNVIGVSAAGRHNFALRSDGTVVSWGDNAFGRTTVPAGLINVVAVAASWSHTLALLADGTVAAWGDNYYGQAAIPAGLSEVIAVAAGSDHNLALRADKTVIAWGDNYDGQCNVPAGLTNVVAVAAGNYHSLALRSDGTVVVWGANFSDQTNVPAGLNNVIAIDAGGYNSIALMGNGKPFLTSPLPDRFTVAGGTVFFQASAAGDRAMSYQWQWNGTNLPNATNAILALRDVQPVQAGTYSVVVSNHWGYATSQAAVLEVIPAWISTQPQSQTAPWGGSAQLRLEVNSIAPVSYQWLCNGVNLPGATNATLQLSNLALLDEGRYSVVVSNAYGVVTSAEAVLSLVIIAAWGDNSAGQSTVPAGLNMVVGIAAGDRHSLALRHDGTVVAWGDNSCGQAAVPADLTNVLSIGAGALHSIALKADGTVVAWGYNQEGQASVPAGLDEVTALAGGYAHTLALLADGTVLGWGANSDGQTKVPAGLNNATAIAAGWSHSLALRADGHVVAWGDNTSDQTSVPIGLSNVVAVAAGDRHNLALQSDGKVVAWGYNCCGQTTVPTNLGNIAAIAAGGNSSLALRTDGTLVCWGIGESEFPSTLSNLVEIAAGWGHNLALIGNGRPSQSIALPDRVAPIGGIVYFHANVTGARPLRYQWQWNGTNLPNATDATLLLTAVQPEQTGLYSLAVSNAYGVAISRGANLTVVPAWIPTHPQPQVVLVGGNAVFGVEVQSSVPVTYQWWRDGTNLVGATNTTLQLTKLSPEASGRYSVVVSNAYGVVTSDESMLTVVMVAGWGFDYYGQNTLNPGLKEVVAIAAGGWYSLALQADGTVVAWGANYDGQTNVPAGLSNVVAISAGDSHCLALRSDGTVVAWGDDFFNQCSVPAGLTNVVGVDAGSRHSLALQADGTVVAWGDTADGQTIIPAYLTNVVAVAAGERHSLAVRADGSVVAWGDNYFGQCTVPAGLTDVVAAAAGDTHSVALRADGSVVLWGYSESFPTDLINVVAVAAGSGAGRTLVLRADGTVVVCGGDPAPADLTNVVAVDTGWGNSLALLGYGKPFLMNEPADRLVIIGGTVYFHANASGAGAMSYQWQCNGTNLPNATNAILILRQVQPAQAGIYSVVLSNAVGVTSSRGAWLTVVPALITANPQSQNLPLGWEAVLAVEVQSTVPVTYQWRFSGTNLVGATNDTLFLNKLTFDNRGRYSVVVSNAYGVLTSADANLSVVRVAAWGANHYGKTIVPASLTNVTAIAAGSQHNLALRTDGTVVAWGAQTTVPAGLSNVTAIAAGASHSLALRADGTVFAWGDNSYGQATAPEGLSNVVSIDAGPMNSVALRTDGTVVAWGQFSIQMENLPVSVPSGLSNVVGVANGGAYSLALYDDTTVAAWGMAWGQTIHQMGWSNVVALSAGRQHSLALQANGSVMVAGDYSMVPPDNLTDVTTIAAGDSHCLAVRANGTVVAWGLNYFGAADVPLALSNVVQVAGGSGHSLALIGDGSPIFSVQPVSRRVLVNNPINMTVFVNGQQLLSYQWQFNGTNLNQATNASLTFDSAQLANAGIYSVVVSNAMGMVTSRVAQLTVLAPPSLQPMPDSVIVPSGTNLMLSIEASGTPPLRYQWRKNGVNIAGATNDTLTLTNVQMRDGGSYSVVVANLVGTAASAPVLLLVEVPPVSAGDNFANRVFLSGATNSVSGTNYWATRETGEPAHANKRGSNSVWYAWRAPATGIATFCTLGSTFDTLLGIYVGTNMSELVSVASDEDRGGYLTSEARFNVQEDLEYEIAVDGLAGQQGAFILSWELEPTLEMLPVITAAPVSQTVREGHTAWFTVGAVGEALTYQWRFNFQPISGATGAVLQLSSVQPEHVGFYTVAITNSFGRGLESLPGVLEIGSVPDVHSVAKWEDLPAAIDSGSGLRKLVQAGSSSGSILLVGAGTIGGQILNNTAPTNSGVSLPTNNCGAIGGCARWLNLKATNSGTMVLDTIGSTIDTLLAIYTGNNLLTYSLVACDDNSAPDGIRSWVRFEAETGTVYSVVVDGVDGTQGTIQLHWALGRAPEVQVIPTNIVVKPGASLRFSVIVTQAIPTAQCQWQLNNRPLPGATNAWLDLVQLRLVDAGFYTVLVRNAIAVVEKTVATVTVEPPLVNLVESTFDQDIEGWTCSGEITNWFQQPTGGKSGGYLAVLGQRAGGWWSWRAPGKFFGDRSLAYGGWLQFELKQTGTALSTNPPEVRLNGGGVSLIFTTLNAPGTNWTSYQIPLLENKGWKRADRLPALREEILQVLSRLDGFEIYGQFSAAGGSSSLDEVTVLAPCTEEAPALSIRCLDTPSSVVLEWPLNAVCYQLETALTLSPPDWTTNVPVVNTAISNNLNVLTINPSGQSRFFRLRQR